MSYWSQMYRSSTPSPHLEVENGAIRFESLLSKELSEGDRKFAESLDQQLKKANKLSPEQVECLERMEDRYSAEAIAARSTWAKNYKAVHRPLAIIVANYYITTHYFRDLALKIGTDENFVPTERQFLAMTENKYAKKAIMVATNPPPFPVGTLAKIRANINLVSSRRLHDQIGLVTANHATGLYASSTLLVNGDQVTLEDRCLKAPQRAKKK